MINFDYLKVIKKEMKKKGLDIDGIIIAWSDKEKTGTRTICENLGVRLRLIEEGKIQQLLIEKMREKIVDSDYSQLDEGLSLEPKDKLNMAYVG